MLQRRLFNVVRSPQSVLGPTLQYLSCVVRSVQAARQINNKHCNYNNYICQQMMYFIKHFVIYGNNI